MKRQDLLSRKGNGDWLKGVWVLHRAPSFSQIAEGHRLTAPGAGHWPSAWRPERSALPSSASLRSLKSLLRSVSSLPSLSRSWWPLLPHSPFTVVAPRGDLSTGVLASVRH